MPRRALSAAQRQPAGTIPNRLEAPAIVGRRGPMTSLAGGILPSASPTLTANAEEA